MSGRDNKIDYKAVFENSLEVFIIISSETGCVVEANDAALNLLKYSRDEFRNLKAKDLIAADEYQMLVNAHRRDLTSFDETYVTTEFLTKYQKKIPVSVSVKNLKKSNQFLLIARDISGIKQTEQALKREAFVFENLNDAVILTDLDGYIQSWNKAAGSIFGYSRKEILDKYICNLIRLAEIENFFEATKKEIQNESFWTGETKIVRKDNTEGVSETSVFPFRDSSNEHIAYVIIVKDITQRKIAEQEMRERDLMYGALIESSGDAIYVLKDKRLLLVNPAWCKLFGYTKEEALSEDFDIMSIVAAESKKQIDNRYAVDISQRPESASYEMKGLTKDNHDIDLDVKVTKIKWKGKEVFQGIYRDITEKKRAEIEIKESEEKFRKLAEKSLVGIYIIQDGIFQYVNPKLAEIFGYNIEELIVKKGPYDLTAEKDRKMVREFITSRVTGKVDSISYEFIGLKKNREEIYVEALGSRTVFRGKPGVVGTLLDVTDRKKSEEILKESEKKYRTIIESATDAIIIVDVKTGIIVDLNFQAEYLTGSSRRDLIGRSHLLLHPPNYWNEYKRKFKIVTDQKKKIIAEEVLVQHKDGSIIPVEINNSTYTLNGREVIQGIFRDLRERKKVEEEIRKLSRALEQSPTAIVITDTKGNIEYVNPHFCKVTGYSVEEAMGQNPRILKSGATSAEEYKNLWETIASGKEWHGEFQNKKRNGELYWEQASISPIRDTNGNITHYIAMKEDITDKKQLQQELLFAKEKAEESDRMKSEFLSQMSHEIRTPLNVILSYNSFLRDELADQLNEDVKLSFISIDSAGKRLLRTIDMILNLSAIQKGKIHINFDKVSLNKILNGFVKEFRFQAKQKNISLKLNLPEEQAFVLGDDYIVGEIFQNIINNAMKYTNEGVIEINVEKLNEGKTKIDIIDTGIGISEEYLPKLFMPFTQEETGYTRKFEGNGLGLALVKSYLDLLQAEIKVKSEKGKGTTFSIFFNEINHA
jgi:PAS domain S-box-containing protein